jgi:hypothetical protein
MTEVSETHCEQCSRLRKTYNQTLRYVAQCEKLRKGHHPNVATYKKAVGRAEKAERARVEARCAITVHHAETGHAA